MHQGIAYAVLTLLASALYGQGLGYINKGGKFVIGPAFRKAERFHEGIAYVVKLDGTKGYIDKTGRFVITLPPNLRIMGNGEFSEGMAAIETRAPKGPKCGYINKTGKVVVKPQFEYCNPFSEGLAAVRFDTNDDRHEGYIDKSGKLVIEAAFYSADDFHDGLAHVSLPRTRGEALPKGGYIDKTGKVVIGPLSGTCGETDQEGLVKFRAANKHGGTGVGLRDNKSCKVVLPAMYDTICQFHEGLAIVSVLGPGSEEKGGYIDKAGRVVIEPQYDGATNFSEGLAGVMVGGKFNARFGYVDITGKWVIEPRFEVPGRFDHTFDSLTVPSFGRFDWETNVPNYFREFHEGLAAAKLKTGKIFQFGYIDRTGKIVIGPRFEYADDFSEGLAAAGSLSLLPPPW